MRFTPGFVARVEHSSLDALVEVARTSEWSADVMQIGRGPFQGSATLVETRDLQASVSEWRPGLMVRGATPSRATNFDLVVAGVGSTWEDGEAIDRTDIIVDAGGAAYDLRALAAHRRIVVSVADGCMNDYAMSVLGMPLEALHRTGRLKIPDARAAEAVAEALRNLIDWAAGSPSLLADPRIGEIFTGTVLDTMLLDTVPAAKPAGRLDTYRAARRAEAFIRESASEPLSIQQLCLETGLTERTLFHVFHKHFGHSPKAYLRMARLNGAHGDLRRAPSGATVTDVATRWGFFHFGRFATYYREAFGELPSATLRRYAVASGGPR